MFDLVKVCLNSKLSKTSKPSIYEGTSTTPYSYVSYFKSLIAILDDLTYPPAIC